MLGLDFLMLPKATTYPQFVSMAPAVFSTILSTAKVSAGMEHVVDLFSRESSNHTDKLARLLASVRQYDNNTTICCLSNETLQTGGMVTKGQFTWPVLNPWRHIFLYLITFALLTITIINTVHLRYFLCNATTAELTSSGKKKNCITVIDN